MNEKEALKNNLRVEEIRGLFVLGLLAVLATIRFQAGKIIVTIGQVSFDIIPLLDITIVLWSFYAFFMVLGLSEDLIGKTASEAFRSLSKTFLSIDFALLAMISLIASLQAFLVFFYAFPTRSLFILGLITIIVSYKVYGPLKKLKPTIEIMSLLELLSIMVTIGLTSVIILMIISPEQYIVPIFLIGVFFELIYIIAERKIKKTKK
ncbi:MAG: hypothetical protein FGF48_07215 [Candidatus Brockarchaeota archaeon]|nr:hypothetical protein [Candidatus Brockarchaeota archaeon]